MVKFIFNKVLSTYIFFLIMIALSFSLSSNTRLLHAVTTNNWINTDQTHFSKGKINNVTVHNTGELTLSPNKRAINGIRAAYVWCLASNETGSIFAGTGDPGSIFKITESGNIIEFYKTQELHVQSIAIDFNGNIYAGTLPHGRIYKILPDGRGEIFCELPDPYVWDINIDGNGNLYAATGDNGIIYKISNQGIPSVLFDSPYTNILDMIIDEDNNIYATCEPEGLIYKITTDGKVFVLYDTEEDEIHCLAIDKKGILYAGTSSGIPPVLPVATPPAPPEFLLPPPIEELPQDTNDAGLTDILLNTKNNDLKRPYMNNMNKAYIEEEIREKPVTAEKNSVYRIDIDRRVKKIFTAEKAFILSLTVDTNSDVFVCTGNRAKLFRINNDDEVTSLLYEFNESQILDILPYKDDRKYIATGNNANIYLLSNEYSKEGTYESVVHDTSFISSWGCISWEGQTPLQTEVKVFTRTGNSKKPDATWSNWSQEYQDNVEKIKSPSARFIQYQVTFTTNNPTVTPILDSVNIAYLPQNQPPLIRSITIGSPENSYVEKSNTNKNKEKGNPELVIREPKKLIYWESNDPNNDKLQFDLEYKGVDEKKWKELERDIKEESKYNWNTNRIPDGHYKVKVIANDILDNPIEIALKEEKVSNTFLVDNTRPIISDLKEVTYTNNTLIISGIARDDMSNITKIQYSIDSGDWSPVFPVDRIFDSKEESFLLKIPYISPEEHTVLINAIDAENNIGSNRIIFNP